MQEAGLITFLRTLGIILLIIYGLKFIVRYILPLLLRRAIYKTQERARNQKGYYHRDSPKTNVGETTIDKKPKQYSKDNANVGEYIDFEEID